MKKLQLSIATQDYDHFRDFRLGTVQAEGIEHIWLMPELHEIFAPATGVTSRAALRESSR